MPTKYYTVDKSMLLALLCGVFLAGVLTGVAVLGIYWIIAA